jgi:curved DNA-binding protein CbpA
MTPRQDPYRVLGLVPGATPGEIRSAYRRLAKLHHPDAAGERSLPRFLAIRAAYEELLDGDGRLRVPGWPARGGGGGTARATRGPAKGASRDAWRARRAAGSEGADTGAGASSNSKSGAGSNAGGPAGSSSGGLRDSRSKSSHRRASGAGSSRPSGGGAGRRSGERRSARPGSTTYDEASQPLDPSWEGGAWYGASSGRYWTLNPREYADPRKHGPEYQERARRATKGESARRGRPGDAGPADAGPAEAPPPPDGSAGEPPPPDGSAAP